MRFHAGSRTQSPSRGMGQVAAWTREVDCVFLVGAARSGTTWLQAMLASHPEIYSGPETHFFSTYHPVEMEFWREKDRDLGVSSYLGRDAFYELMADSFRRVISGLPEPSVSKRYFLEKSPHHCLSAEFIVRTFPNARFIHLVRDPRSVVASLLRVSKSWGESWAPNDAEEAARQWVERVEASSHCASLVADSNLFAEVRYEDLRSQPEAALTSLFEFLGLPVDTRLVESIVREQSLEKARETARPFATIASPEHSSKPQSAYPADFIGAAPTDGRDAGLDEAALQRVEAIAGPLMRQYGYQPVRTAASRSPRFAASVLLVTDGDDPRPALETLSAMAPKWREDWELLVVAHGGSAGNRVAECLEGDFQLLPFSPKLSYAGVLGHAAARARGEEIFLAKSGELLPLDRRRLSALVDAPYTDPRQTIQWLVQGASPALSLS